MFDTSISPIATTKPDVFAFRITGTVTAPAMEEMAAFMNDQFDRHDSVSMLMIFDRFEGREAGAGLNLETLKAQFRSLAKVEKYAVVGAPDGADTMIAVMDKLMPVDARTFDVADLASAWAFVGAGPASGTAV